MAYSSTNSNFKVSTDSNCSSSCLENVKILKEQNEQLLKDLRTSKLNVIAYKTGLESIEARLLVYKKNESVYEEDIKVLKRKIHLREVAITELRRKLELAQKQKDEIQLTVENFENSSKSLSKLIDCQIVDKCKTSLGYNVVPPPYTRNVMPPKPDLSFSGLKEFVNEPIVSEPTVKKPVVETSKTKTSEAKPKAARKNNGSPIIEDWVSNSEKENVSQTKIEKKTAKPSFVKIDFIKAKQTNKTDRKTTKQGNPQQDLQEKGVINSGYSRHMTGNMSYLTDFEEIDGGYVAFVGNPKGGKIIGKGTIKTGNLDFENVYFVRELKVNLFSVSQMCDKKNSVLFNDTKCIVLSPNFKLTDESYVLLKVPRKNNMYSVDLKNIIPKGGLTCLIAKSTSDESKLWHRRLGHINFKTMNKLVKGNLVRGLPSKHFENNQTCVACQKGKQHKASYHLGKFDGKADEGFFVGYSINSKAFRVFNSRTRIVEENLHVQFSENTPNIARSGPNWLFDIDALTKLMNYKPVITGNQSNGNAGTKTCNDAGKARMETVFGKDYILLPFWTADLPFSQSSKSSPNAGFKPSGDNKKKVTEEPEKEGGDPSKEGERDDQEKDANVNSTNNVYTVSSPINIVGSLFVNADALTFVNVADLPDDPNMPPLEDIVYSDDDEDVGAEADMHNLNAFMPISPIPTIRVHKDHLVEQIIGDLNSAPQTRRMTKNLEEHGLFSSVQERTNHKDFQNCMFACFLSKVESKKVWTLVVLPNRKSPIGTKWVYRKKKDERGIVIKNKARLVAQGYTQEEWIDYNEVFAPVARIKAIRLFLSYASFKDFVVYQMDIKSAFLYGTLWTASSSQSLYETLLTYLLDNRFQRGKIDKTLFIRRDKGDILLVQVYVDDIIFGFTKKSLCTEFKKMMHKKFQMSSMGELTFFLGLQVKQKEDGIFISQDKYVTEILKKFGFTDVKTASTPMETHKPLLKDENDKDIDKHMYRSMIGSLMYLTSLRPDIMFVVCTCARYQVNPKASHLHAVKRIFRYLKGQPKLGLWYPKDLPFDLVAYTDSDYAGASLDRKYTIGGCQFLREGCLEWNGKSAKDEIRVSAGKFKLVLLGKISSPKDTKTPISTSSSVGFSSPVRSTTPPPNYPLISYLSGRGIKPLGSEPVPRTYEVQMLVRHSSLDILHDYVQSGAAEAWLCDVAVYYHLVISTFPVKIVIKSSAFILEYLLQPPIRKPALCFMKPFGCPVTILNTIDHLGKFDGKVDEGFFIGYSINRSRPNWLFDIDALTKSMNYKPVVAGNQSNGNAGTKACDDAGKARMETVPSKDYILLPLWNADPPFSYSSKSSLDDGFKPSDDDGTKIDENPRKYSKGIDQEEEDNDNSTNNVNAASINEVNVVGAKTSIELPDDPNMPELEDIVYSDDDEDVGAEADMNNLDAFMPVSPIPTTRVHKDHPVEQIIRDLNSAPQTRRMTKNLKEHGLFSSVQQRTNHKDFQNCLFACFLSQEEPKKVIHALKDPSWIEAMQEELLQFKNKKDERGIVIKNKARLVAQGYTQEEGIDYDEVFAPVARIEAIRLFLAYASFKDFVVHQMDVKSTFLYGKNEEEVYVCKPPGFKDPDFPDRVYKVEKALYGLHQAPRAWYETLSTYLLDNGFQRRTIDKTLFIKRDKGDILLVQVYVDDIIFGSTKRSLCTEFEKMIHKNQDKYVTEILKKFGFTDVKTASTPIETQKPLLKDEDGEQVDVHLYRSMIGSLMYLTSSRPAIMFAVYACARYQVNPKVSHLHAVKRIFRYLKGQPKLGLWYPKDSPFDMVAYTDSDYARASLDRKSTTVGCQFLGCRLISWQCKKQTVVANSITEAEYVAALRKDVWKGMEKLLRIEFELVLAKTVNGEVQLQALMDRKKIVITESTIRRDLQLEDAKDTDCLPNATIFEQLTLMGYEKLSQKLTFYKAFFSLIIEIPY
ncbi:putative ribonuclease H-like domain-containing protein [Tanacetum coccineum]